MSADIQTRKRKDKKRRKEDESPPFQPTIPVVTNNHSSNDDVTIHVHKEGGLGGGICAKLVFFVLFSALAVLIGLIITEHRGLTDVEVADTNSKFSQIFEGWTDASVDHHGDEHEEIEEILSEEHGEHDEEDDLEANTSEAENEEEHEHSDEEADTAEDDDDDADRDEEDDKEEENEDDDDEDDEKSINEDEDSAENEDNDDENPLSQEQLSTEQDKEDYESAEVDDEDRLASEENDEDDGYTQRTSRSVNNSEEDNEQISEEKEDAENEDDELDRYDDDDDERDDDNIDDGDKDEDEKEESEEQNVSEEEDEKDGSQEHNVSEIEDEKEESQEQNLSEEEDDLNRSDENEDNSLKENLNREQQDDEEYDDDKERFARKASKEASEEQDRDIDDEDNKVSKEYIQTVEDKEPEVISAQREPDDNVQESSGMAVKVGVGVALLVVAHLVLCRKWRSASDDKPHSTDDTKESTPDLSRRNTIIVPPTFQEVEQDIEHDEEDLSEEEELSDQQEIEPRTVKERYTELRSTYSNTLGPEGESLVKPVEYEDENEYDEEVDEEISEEEEEDDDEDDLEEEEEDTEDEECDEDDNEELLKRLDAKYGKLPASAPDVKRISQLRNEVGEAHGSVTKNVTNKDQKLRQVIDDAHDAIEYNPAYAVKLFDKILEKFPSSPRSIYGKALALNRLADQKRSNEILYSAIRMYTKLLNMPDVPDDLYQEAVEKSIKVMRFVGQYKNLLEIHRLAIKRFPNSPKYYNELAVTYLTINRIGEARPVLKEVLEKWPNDGFALVHHGFILKTVDNKLEEAVHYLKRGIATNDTGVVDGRFYFHLGDALERLGKHEEAMQVYEEGTKNKVFLSKYQRSLYNVKRLTGKPFWEEHELPYSDLFRELQQHWKIIRDEGLSALNGKGYFQDESENLRDTGEWKQFELFARGQKNIKNCAKSPFTCSLIEKIPEAKGCKRGQTKFSVMHPGTHVWPHCGPTNCRLRVHLGLKVPPKTYLRVADELRSWKEGNILIFDDSFEHEVWHNGTELRLVLIVDIWHPELSAREKRNLSPI